MSYLDDIEAWAAAQLHRADVDRAHIRKLVVVARAVRRWREATCVDVGDCVDGAHGLGCPVELTAADLVAADDAVEIP